MKTLIKVSLIKPKLMFMEMYAAQPWYWEDFHPSYWYTNTYMEMPLTEVISSTKYVEWTRFDVYVKSPIFKLTAFVLNKLRRSKVDEEWRNYQALLDMK